MAELFATILLCCCLAGSVINPGYDLGIHQFYVPGIFLFMGAILAVGLRLSSRLPPIDKEFITSPVVIALLAFFIAGVASIAYVEPGNILKLKIFGFRTATVVTYVLLPVYVFAHLPKKPAQLRVALLSYAGAGVLFAALCLLQTAVSGLQYDMSSSFGHKNFAGDVSAISAIICLAFTIANTFPRLRYMFILGSVVCLGSAVVTNARAATLSVPLAIVFMAGLHGTRSWISKSLLVVGALCVIVLSYGILPAEVRERLANTEAGTSAAARPYYWQLSTNYIEQNPFRGVGWGNEAVTSTGYRIDNPCNFFLQIWIETGPQGVLCAVPFYILLTWSLFSNCQTLKKFPLLSAISMALLGVFIERFLRDFQDLYNFGSTMGSSFFAAVGMTVFLQAGIKKGALEKLQKKET